MIWGMTLATFTEVHVALSLVAIAAGFVVMTGLLGGRDRGGWTALFLVTTVATSVTGFGFPVDHLLPSHVIGIVSLVVLAVAIVARYGLRLRGAWRPVYVVGAARALSPADGAAISGRAARRAGAVHRPCRPRGKTVPS